MSDITKQKGSHCSFPAKRGFQHFIRESSESNYRYLDEATQLSVGFTSQILKIYKKKIPTALFIYLPPTSKRQELSSTFQRKGQTSLSNSTHHRHFNLVFFESSVSSEVEGALQELLKGLSISPYASPTFHQTSIFSTETIVMVQRGFWKIFSESSIEAHRRILKRPPNWKYTTQM